jgi:hypothetical protein
MGDFMSTIKANDLQNASGGIPTVKGQQLISTAWVNFDGTGTVAINDSENVSSITDVATGEYKVNFTTAMTNANYCVATNGSRSSSQYIGTYAGSSWRTVSWVQVKSFSQNTTTQADTDTIDLVIMGGQA